MSTKYDKKIFLVFYKFYYIKIGICWIINMIRNMNTVSVLHLLFF